MSDPFTTLHAAGVPITTLVWLLPLLVAAALSRTRTVAAADAVAIGGSFVVFLLCAGLALTGYRVHEEGFFFETRLALGPVGYHVGLDALGSLFLLVTSLLGVLVSLYGHLADKARRAAWHARTQVLLGSLLLLVVSLDLLQVGVALALELVPAVLLVLGWGSAQGAPKAARALAGAFGLSTALWLVGAVLLRLGGGSFDLIDLLARPEPIPHASLIFGLVATAIAIRLPLFPLHTWLPPVLEHGPVVALNVHLLGVKVGAFLLVRFAIPLLPDAAADAAWTITALGVAGMVYGALAALAQTDLRRTLAFAVVSHMGFVLPAMFALNVHGVEGALLEAVNLGLAGAGFTFVLGFLQLRVGSTELDRLRGLAAGVPLLSLTFLVIVLSTIGMPGTSGFEGMHLALEGALDAHHYGVAVVVAAGAVVLAGVMLFVFQRTAFAPLSEADPERIHDLERREVVIAVAVCAVVLGIGVFSDPWIEALHETAETVSARVHHLSPEQVEALEHTETEAALTGSERTPATHAEVPR